MIHWIATASPEVLAVQLTAAVAFVMLVLFVFCRAFYKLGHQHGHAEAWLFAYTTAITRRKNAGLPPPRLFRAEDEPGSQKPAPTERVLRG